MYLFRLPASAIEEYREEADGDVEDLAGYFVAVDLCFGLALLRREK